MKTSRRQFFTAVAGMMTVGLASTLVQAEERRRARGSDKPAAAAGPLGFPIVNPKDQAAQALNYVEKHSDLKKADLKAERMGVAFEKQFCTNCSFYASVGNKDGAAVGTCTIFPAKLVKSQAWCSSWNKKA